jgi:hypothetical protein
MKAIASGFLVALLFILGIFLVLAIGGGLLVLLSYGLGWILNRILPFDPFQVTIISLAGMLVFGILAERIWKVMMSAPSPSLNDLDEEEDGFDSEDEYFDENDEQAIISVIPRWRQRSKTIDFSNVKPDDRCPCGSGRKYKNCHGRKKSKQ